MRSRFRQFRYEDKTPLGEKVKRLAWGLTYWLCFRPSPRWFMHSWRRYILILFGAKIGVGCRIAPTARIWAPWRLRLGDFVAIGDEVDLYCVDNITIGAKVAISQRSFLCTGSHNVNSLRRPLVTRPIVIRDHAWICAEAYLAPGVEVGTGAVVGARACVYKEVEDWTIVGGNPAKFIKQRVVSE